MGVSKAVSVSDLKIDNDLIIMLRGILGKRRRLQHLPLVYEDESLSSVAGEFTRRMSTRSETRNRDNSFGGIDIKKEPVVKAERNCDNAEESPSMRTTRRSSSRKSNSGLSKLKEKRMKTEPTSEGVAATVIMSPPGRTLKATKLEQRSPALPSTQSPSTKSGDVKRPKNWEVVLKGIQEMRSQSRAPVDTMGCEAFADPLLPDHLRRFHVLVGALLSSQTKDEVTSGAMDRLRAQAAGLSVNSIADIPRDELAQLLKPVGFYNNKATYLKKTCDVLLEATPAGTEPDIPRSVADLVRLPGIGPKMAHLIMNVAWERCEGICVDTHVHRISNRLGWVRTLKTKAGASPSKGQDAEKTRRALEEWLPQEHWVSINPLLVGFGQTICTPVRPACDTCSVAHLCPAAPRSLRAAANNQKQE